MLFRERQQMLICVVAGALIAGFVLFRYLPLRKRIKAVEHTRASQKAAAIKVLAESGQLPVLKERLQKLKTVVGDYDAKMPGRRNLGVFLHKIANLMNEHDLREQLIQPAQEVEAEGLNCVPVSMQCKGRLGQIFNFFGSLQTLERLVRIERIKLENDKDFNGELSMRTEAVIYYRPEDRRG